MKKLVSRCVFCNSTNIKFKKNKKIALDSSNPGKIVFVSDCAQCEDCGELYFDEKTALKNAKEIDKLLDAKADDVTIKVPSKCIIA